MERPINSSRLMTINNSAIFKDVSGRKDEFDEVDIIDSDWVKCVFLVSDDKLEEIDQKNKFWTSAHMKFTDTTLGGNLAINARPQFTRYCDIKGGSRITDSTEVSVSETSGGYGMGRYYSEAIDDNVQNLYLEFGVPKFNSLFTLQTKLDSLLFKLIRAVSDLTNRLCRHKVTAMRSTNVCSNAPTGLSSDCNSPSNN